MTIPQIIAAIIIIGALIYFFYDVIRHAKKRGGSIKDIILRTLIWILVFLVLLVINTLINSSWVPGKLRFIISF